MEPQYEEQFTALIDFLGFAEFSRKNDETIRAKVLDLLVRLSELRGEFDFKVKTHEAGISTSSRPTVSTFSDHIVISYPLKPMAADGKFDETTVALMILNHFTMLVTSIAAAALRIGFVIGVPVELERKFTLSSIWFLFNWLQMLLSTKRRIVADSLAETSVCIS